MKGAVDILTLAKDWLPKVIKEDDTRHRLFKRPGTALRRGEGK
jgi:hypothetical protein